MSRKKIVIEVRGQPNEYWTETLYAWLLEDVVDILANEYNIDIEVKLVEENRGEPIIVCCGHVIEDIPSEPGYLIEALKKILDRVLMSGASQRPERDEEA